MEHQYATQHWPLHPPSHSSGDSRRSSRSSSRGRDGDEDDQHPGHIMQSRSALASHSLSKRARSRSKGRRRRQAAQEAQQEVQHARQEIQQQAQSRMRTRQLSSDKLDAFDDFISGEVETSATRRNSSSDHLAAIANAVHNYEGKINEHGRCIRHPTIELACRDTPSSPWRILQQECPLCSLDDSGMAMPALPTGKINYVQDGASSQPSTKTHRTATTAEDSSSVKSWTVSDASDSEDERDSSKSRASRESAELMFRPPPPPRAKPALNQRQTQIPQRQQFQQMQQPSAPASKFDPVQSLKELGRKLVQESEAENSLAIFDDNSTVASALQSRYPPPPPKRDGRTSSGRQVRPPPRRETSASMGESSEDILGEASDIIARMESRTSEGGGPSSSRRMKARQRLAQQYQEERLKLSGTEESLTQACDVVNMMASFDVTEGGETHSSRRSSSRRHRHKHPEQEGQTTAEDEKAAKAQRRKEKAERKAARHRERELRKQRQQNRLTDEGTFTMPMKDGPARGREREIAQASGTDDILQAAAAIRARARRSASRSRERIKEASLFIGETPMDTAEDSEGDHISLSSEKRRSILNPHGFEEQPAPTRVERRSQSRERRRSHSRGRDSIDQSDGRSIGERSSGSRRYQPRQQSTAEELLSRRREMRQQIAERQSSAQSKRDHRRAGSGGRVDEMSLGDEWLEGRSQSNGSSAMMRRSRGRTDDRGEGRRGRSRSAVRDGISKIRSASLKPFKKASGKIGKSWERDDEGGSVGSGGTGKRSAATSASSFKRMLSKAAKPRSLSRGRSVGGEWAAKSDPFVTNDDDNRSAGVRSTSASSLGLGMFKKKSKQKNKGGGGMGMVRSLSRGSFRHQSNGLDCDARSEVFPSRNSGYENEWEMRSMGRAPFRRSSSDGSCDRGF